MDPRGGEKGTARRGRMSAKGKMPGKHRLTERSLEPSHTAWIDRKSQAGTGGCTLGYGANLEKGKRKNERYTPRLGAWSCLLLFPSSLSFLQATITMLAHSSGVFDAQCKIRPGSKLKFIEKVSSMLILVFGIRSFPVGTIILQWGLEQLWEASPGKSRKRMPSFLKKAQLPEKTIQATDFTLSHTGMQNACGSNASDQSLGNGSKQQKEVKMKSTDVKYIKSLSQELMQKVRGSQRKVACDAWGGSVGVKTERAVCLFKYSLQLFREVFMVVVCGRPSLCGVKC